MNDKLVEICALRDQMYERMTKLDDALVQAAEIRRITDTVESLVKSVQNYGFNNAIVDKINSCKQFKDYCDVELSLKYKSVESFGEAAVEAIKKFFSVIGTIVKKVIEFLQNALNTTSGKCRQIIDNRQLILLDKKVNIIKKEDLDKMQLAAVECKRYLDKHAEIDFEFFGTSPNFESGIEDIVKASDGIISYNKDTGALTLVPPKAEPITLKEAGYNVNDVTSLASSFVTKTKSYTAIGQLMTRLYNNAVLTYCKMRADNNEDNFEERYAEAKRIIQASTTVYGVMAKGQAVIANQLVAYWNCLKKDDDDTVPANAESVHVGNLPYDATESDVKNALKPFVTVYKVEISRNKFTGHSHGNGTVYVAPGGREILKSKTIVLKGREMRFGN